ncbi:hypothetical protein [Streptomyces sp. NPDC002054]|uniref:hypothetical protein n=1 Tax=Streptomyces sp. NPDC002054 TaxID=3154663 RepID=UPI00332FFF04
MTAREEFSRALLDAKVYSGLSMRQIAEGADPALPVSLVASVLNGGSLPGRDRFERLLTGLQLPKDHADHLRVLRNRAVNESGRERPPTPRVPEPSYVVNGGNVTIQQYGPSSESVPQYGRPSPLHVTTPADFVAALNAVHIWAGKPTLRKLVALGNGILKRSTVSDMLNGCTVPSLDRCTAFLRACGISDVEDWVFTWRRLKALEQPHAAPWLPGASG